MLLKERSKLILATRNPHKVIEIKSILSNFNIDIVTLNDYPDVPEVVEDGATIEENALKKAKEVHRATGITSLADDTGLEVDHLNGQPGVFSSRFAGDSATYAMNNAKLLTLMNNVPWERRTACFRCVIAIAGEGLEYLMEGRCNGYILNETRGDHGFGYDPLFYVPEYAQTFSQMPASLKNQISHRGKALQKLKCFFENIA
ncbi:XTP/dITP diphosphatase [candidate division KSB1 bacterium]|nr:XTP/dITP diphosphatase [candidate division KSB1 bacterium]